MSDLVNTVNLDDLPLPNSDNQASVRPYDIGSYLWSFIEAAQVSQNGVDVVQAFPNTMVDRPTVSWRVLRRVPGRGKNTTVTGKGANFTRLLKSQDNYIYEVYSQVQTIQLEFAVFAASASEADDVAWNLENAIIQASGLVQEEIPGFTLTFIEQLGDTNMNWDRQDELCIRTLRFECTIPISFTRVVPEIQRIEYHNSVGYTVLENRFTRADSNNIFYLPIDSTKRVVRIHEVALFGTVNQFDPLIKNVDYLVKTDKDQKAFIEWQTGGKAPSVGQEFQVRYSIATSRETKRTDVTNKKF